MADDDHMISQVTLTKIGFDALHNDAKRYRWLRDHCQYAPSNEVLHGGKLLDEFCDVGMLEDDEDELAPRRD